MKEIEVKVLAINKTALTKKFLKLGAKKIGRVFIVDKTFDYPDHRLEKRGDHLRIRAIGSKTTLTYKKNVSKNKKFKIKEETEIFVEDFAKLETILLNSGFVCTMHHEKYRTSFKFKNTHCEIDEYPVIPPYLEIEGNQKTIINALKMLEINFSEACNLIVPDVLKKYGAFSKIIKFK